MSWQPVTAHDAAMVGYTSRVKLTVPEARRPFPNLRLRAARRASARRERREQDDERVVLGVLASHGDPPRSQKGVSIGAAVGIRSDSEPDWARLEVGKTVRLMQARNDAVEKFFAKLGLAKRCSTTTRVLDEGVLSVFSVAGSTADGRHQPSLATVLGRRKGTVPVGLGKRSHARARPNHGVDIRQGPRLSALDERSRPAC
jgi:hypothetical protein